MRLKGLLLTLLVCALLPLSLHAASVHNEEFSFTVEIPDGFSTYDYLKPHSDQRTRRIVEERTLYAYNKGGDPAQNNYTGIFISLERSAWSGPPGIDIAEPGPGKQLLEETWKGHKIKLYRTERDYTTAGERLVTLNAIIPLKGDPIQIKLTGDASDEPEMRRLLSSMLAGLDGKPGLAAYANGYMYVLITILAITVFILLRRRSARG